MNAIIDQQNELGRHPEPGYMPEWKRRHQDLVHANLIAPIFEAALPSHSHQAEQDAHA